tara:strand:+ start:207 stop:668 length:462 start_codon:yes stop_codon:yes gene_type:complete
MKNLYLIILFILFFNINAHSAFINITEDYKKKSNCKLDKIILKNEIYNYKEFSKDQIKDNKNKNIIISATKSKDLKIIGLSDFFSNIPNGSIYDTQILKDNTILIRVLNSDESYSESVFINKSSGEMLHEITTNINEKNQGKEISFYTCDMSE